MAVPDFFVKSSQVPDFFVKTQTTKPPDVSTTEGLVSLADQHGLGEDARAIAQPEKRLSLLQRLGAALGAFNPAEAVMRATEKGSPISVIPEYVKTVAGGLASGVTGDADYNEGRRGFGEVLESVVPQRLSDSEAVTSLPGPLPQLVGGAEGLARYVASTGADIALDPTTYAGGSMVRGAKTALGTVAAPIARAFPETSAAASAGLKKTKDALGQMFVHGYGTSKGVPEKALELQGALSKAKEDVVESNVERLGEDALTTDQQEALVERLLGGKRLEQKLRDRALQEEARANKAAMEAAETEGTQRAFGLELASKELDDVSREGTSVASTGARVLDDSLTGRDVRLGTAHELSNKVLDAQARNAAERAARVQSAKKAAIDTAMTGSRQERRALRQQLRGGQGIPQLAAQHGNLTDAIEHYARRAAGLRRNDPLTPIVKQQIERSRDFARKAAIEDPMAVYFPSLKNDTTKIQAFLESTSGLRQGIKGYKKQFKDLLKDEELVRNPAEAFAKREFEMTRDNLIAQTQRDIVRDSGKAYSAFKNTDEAAKAGYSLVKTQGMFGKPVGWIKNEDKAFIDSITASGPVEKAVDELARVTGFDAATSLFKRSVTGLFPAFHTRNYVSGHLQNFEVLGKDALNPRNISDGHRMALAMAKPDKAKGMTVKLRGGKDVPMELALRPFEKRFGSSSSYIADIADATADNPSWLGRLMGEKGKLIEKGATSFNPMSAENPAFKTARAVGNFIETQQKATAYLTALRQGKTVEQALDLATRAGFDYRALTKFESKFMRRLIPFYSFTRKNAEMQLKVLGENPQRINQIMVAIDNLGERPSQEERGKLPEYLQGQFATKLDDTAEGRKQYMSGYGTAVEAFADTLDPKGFVSQKVQQFNAPVKTVLESGLGVDAFREKQIKDVWDAKEYRAMPTVVKNWLKLREVQEPIREQVNGKWKDTGRTRTKYVADPERLHLVRNLPTSRLVNTASKMFDKDVDAGIKLLQFFTGLKPQQIDLEAVQRATDKERRRLLADLLERHKSGYTMERFVANKK